MRAVASGPPYCSSVLVPKSKLLHSPEEQYGFVPKHSRHGGKNTVALRFYIKNFYIDLLFALWQ